MVAFILSFLWYSFDDTLAELVGYPPLGELTWWFVFLFIFFFRGINSSNEEKIWNKYVTNASKIKD